jgi:hypothetical protein
MIKFVFEQDEVVNVNSFPSLNNVLSEDAVYFIADVGSYIFNTETDRLEFYSPAGDYYYDGEEWLKNKGMFSSSRALDCLQIIIN